MFKCALILDISKLDICLSLIGLLCSLCLCLSTHQLAVMDATMHAAKHSDSKPNHGKLSHLELLFLKLFPSFLFIHSFRFISLIGSSQRPPDQSATKEFCVCVVVYLPAQKQMIINIDIKRCRPKCQLALFFSFPSDHC